MLTTQTPPSRGNDAAGYGARLLSWLDVAAATLTVAKAWSAHRPTDKATLARAGVSKELQDRVMRLQY